jgi:hypothetical protein
VGLRSQHSELFNLIEYDGPHISIPVLDRVFPQGLDAHDPNHFRTLRMAYDEWDDAKDDPAIHRAWVEFVLHESLGYTDDLLLQGPAIPPGIEARVAEHGETLRPDYVLVNPKGRDGAGKPRLLIRVLPPDQSLDKPEQGSRWKASPDTRMMMLYAPPDDTTGYTSWYANLWLDEQITLRAWRSLLGLRRFFGVADADTLEALLAESAKNQQEVTDQLGLQVRQAVELFVEALDRIDMDHGRKVLADVAPEELYEASLTVMMRLVFLFCAEERGLLLLGDPVYDQFYAVSTLSAQLREVADHNGEEILERRHDAWSRLLATFRAVYGGVQHENLRLTAYGGSLFDPDRFPFLEGRPKGSHWRETTGRPLPVHSRIVLHLMESLQFLQLGGERQRLSFSALGIEQIGHVYEGLLDHTVLRVAEEETVLGLLGAKGKEPEITLSALEAQQAKGEDLLAAFLKEQTGRSDKAILNALRYVPDPETQQRLRVACANNEATMKRVLPFAGLIRDDSFGHLVVVNGGSFYVTQGSERRKTGTHYTPRSLTEPIVQYTLEPLVYEGPAEGWPKENWKLRSPKEILDLKVCDMAMGSGAFLVQTVRYLAERLVEAWDATAEDLRSDATGSAEAASALDKVTASVMARPSSRKMIGLVENLDADLESQELQSPALQVTVEGLPATGHPREQIIPADIEERMLYARRIVCDRCIYGVDINPLAVEMAKLSLWLITMDKGRAFTFLDHSLKCGDSLLGLWDVEQVYKFHLDPAAPAQGGLWGDHLRGIFDYAMSKRRELESFTVVDVRDAEAKARLLADAEKSMDVLHILCDQLISAAVITADGNSQKRGTLLPESFERHRARIFDRLMEASSREQIESAVEAVRALVPEGRHLLNSGNPDPDAPRNPFHWPLEFPEIFVNSDGKTPGVAAFVGNPPFVGGKRITGVMGTDYRFYCMDALANGQKGHADLCAYFFLRVGQLLNRSGGFGLLATNSIAQGDTREVSLDQLVNTGFTITRAIGSRKWPGTASLEVAHVWMRKGAWLGGYVLEDKPVKGITPYLAVPGKVAGNPYRLAVNAGKSFQGTIVLGMGFIMTPDEAQRLISKDPRNKDVLFPYLNGEDLNSRPDQSPSRWVINFHDWPLDRSEDGNWHLSDEKERKKWLQDGRVPADYPSPVAADYPDCLAIVEEKVKPERQRRNPDGQYALRKPLPQRWWIYADKRPALYATIAGMECVLATTQTSKTQVPILVRGGDVYGHKLVVFGLPSFDTLGILTSSIHYWWVIQNGSSLRKDPVYTPSDCFNTFPFPESMQDIEAIAENYHCYRQSLMQARQEGLTQVYNRFHSPAEASREIQELRALHVKLDRAVADAYRWTNLDLGHDFHKTSQGVRFTVCETARRDILDRLLALNHERYAEEVAQGLHDKGKSAKKIKNAEEELFRW